MSWHGCKLCSRALPIFKDAKSRLRDDPRKEMTMSQENTTPTSHDRLESLWHEGSKDIAVAFLRRVISADITLEQLVKALQFEQVHAHLEGLALKDILPQVVQSLRPAVAMQARPIAAQIQQVKAPRRKRRSADEVSALRDALMGRLQAAVGSVTTSHLRDVLSNGGHSVDLLQLGRLLATLEQEGYVTCLGGKPKGWRLKPQGRRAPEPLVIRKARPEPKADESAQS